MKALVLAGLGSLLLVAACEEAGGQGGAETITEPLDAGTSDPLIEVQSVESVDDLPREIIIDKPHLKAEIKFDEAIFSRAPAIAMDIVEDAQIRAEAMEIDALDYQAADPDYFRPYTLGIQWRVVADAGQLMSPEGFIYTHTGGAHGNYSTDARIYNGLTGERLSLGDLFIDPDAALASQMPEVWKAIAWEKVAKSHTSDAADFDLFLNEAEELVVPSMVTTAAVSLVPSDEAGKIGGYTVHFAPYEIGSFAEGAYHITLPQAVFHDDLKPEFASLFAGEPVEIARVDD